MERQPQVEQPPEQGLTKVGPHPLRRGRGQVGDQVSDQRPNPDQRDPAQRRHRRQPRRAELVEERERSLQRPPPDRVVHRHLQRPGSREVQKGLHQDQPRGQRERRPVGPEEGAEGAAWAGWTRGGWSHPSLPRRALARNPAATIATRTNAATTATEVGLMGEAEVLAAGEAGARAAGEGPGPGRGPGRGSGPGRGLWTAASAPPAGRLPSRSGAQPSGWAWPGCPRPG